MKPTNMEEYIWEAPLAKWWDAFPAVEAVNVERITPTVLAEMLRNDAGISVIDVRGDDEYDVSPPGSRVHVVCDSSIDISMQRGHIKGSHHFPAQTFHNEIPAFHEKFSGANAVVFYSGAPRCAGWYQDFLTANDIRRPQVFILDGGFRRWEAEFPGEVESADKVYK
ncbi:Rhodanese-like domain-containing protein [Mycena haematopus]|nr:Rhodanese-like domain-containing protein [Mycena haematopus]